MELFVSGVREFYNSLLKLLDDQKLKARGQVDCATYLRTGSCTRGTGCQFAHPPRILNFNRDYATLNEYLLLLVHISLNPQFSVKNKEPYTNVNLIECIQNGGNVLNIIRLNSLWNEGNYGDFYILMVDIVVQFEDAVHNLCRKLRKFKSADVLILEDVKHKVKQLQAAWIVAEDVLLDKSYNFGSKDGQHLDKSLGETITRRANEAINEVKCSSVERFAIIELLLSAFKQSPFLMNPDVQIWGDRKPYMTLLPFGSSCNSFGFGPCDLDLVLLYGRKYHEIASDYSKILRYHMEKRSSSRKSGSLGASKPSDAIDSSEFCILILEGCQIAADATGEFEVLELVDGARVPVLKLLHKKSQIHVDICINNAFPLHNTLLLKQYGTLFPEVRQLAYAVKTWCKARGVCNPHNATLSSYSWVLLVIYFLIRMNLIRLLEYPNKLSSSEVLSIDSYADDNLLHHSVNSITDELNSMDIKGSSLCIGNLLRKFFAFYSTESSGGFRLSVHAVQLLDSTQSLSGRVLDIPIKSCARKMIAKITKVNAEIDEEEEDPIPEMSTDDCPDKLDGFKRAADNSNYTWRFCIEDPLDLHDLGMVIYNWKGQSLIMSELRRALTILCDANSNGEQVWDLLSSKNSCVPVIPYQCRICCGHHSVDTCPLNVCFYCKQSGHYGKDCPKRLECFTCKGTGHVAKNCPMSKSAFSPNRGQDTTAVSSPSARNKDRNLRSRPVSKGKSEPQLPSEVSTNGLSENSSATNDKPVRKPRGRQQDKASNGNGDVQGNATGAENASMPDLVFASNATNDKPVRKPRGRQQDKASNGNGDVQGNATGISLNMAPNDETLRKTRGNVRRKQKADTREVEN